MKYKIIILFILTIILSSTFVFAVSQPIDILNEFYQASINKDIEKYISVQDPLFLEQQENYKNYFSKSFDEVNILNYKIINPEIFEKENRTLIFYELKGTFKINESKTDIDNDMVAFLWKYNDWKVRWTITRDLFEKKIAYGMIMDTSIEMLFEEASNSTVKQQMIDKGFNVTYNDEVFDEKTSITLWPWIILLMLLTIFTYFYIKKPTFKKRTNNIIKKIYIWLKVIFIPNAVKFLKWLWKWIVKIFKLIFHHSKKAYKKTKKQINKTYTNRKSQNKKINKKEKEEKDNSNKENNKNKN